MLYYELNIDYIIETYCVNKDKPQLQCNGKCHLSKQLQLKSQEDAGAQNTSDHIVESFFPLYYQDAQIVSIVSPDMGRYKKTFPVSIGKISFYHSIIEEPPEVLC